MAGEPVTQTATVRRTLPRIVAGVAWVLDGNDRGRRCDVGPVPIVVGTDPACDLRVRDRKVSRRHCEIRLAAHGFLVRDLNSRNGTFFEGSGVIEIAVPPGAILALGATHLVLLAAGDAATLEPSDRVQLGGLIGISLPMRRSFALLERAASSDATVLLGGETGVGKELAARAIHESGSRASQPFVEFDCGAIAPSLLASELFGHVHGAFTGATSDRAGAFERADGGTLFLDEIGELPVDLQPSLLRACDGGPVVRVGATAPASVDVRIIAATNRDLSRDVLDGRFRRDLYYRLQVLPIVLPPLRARRDDLPLLCAGLLRELGCADPGPIEGDNLTALLQHPFPGNVRELRNVLARALATAGPDARFVSLVVDLDQPVLDAVAAGSFQERKSQVVARFEREYLADLLREQDGNVKKASRASGIERTQLKRLLRKHGLL